MLVVPSKKKSCSTSFTTVTRPPSSSSNILLHVISTWYLPRLNGERDLVNPGKPVCLGPSTHPGFNEVHGPGIADNSSGRFASAGIANVTFDDEPTRIWSTDDEIVAVEPDITTPDDHQPTFVQPASPFK
jgi:hypothetical protein